MAAANYSRVGLSVIVAAGQSFPLLYGSRIERILVDLLGCFWLVYAVSTSCALVVGSQFGPRLIPTNPFWIWHNMVSLCVRRLSAKVGQPSSPTMRDIHPGVHLQ